MVQAATSSDGDGPPRPSDEVLEAVRGAEVYFGFGIPRMLLVAAPNLRWVHSAAAGVGTALYPEMLASDVAFTNSAGIHAMPIAEYVVAGVLHFLRGLDYRDRPAASHGVEQDAVRAPGLGAARDGHGAGADRRRRAGSDGASESD